MASLTFTIAGDPNVIVEVTEVGGDLRFDLSLSSPTGTVADIRGLFFHVANETLLAGLSVSDTDVTDAAFAADAVEDLGDGANVQGVATGPFDVGIEIGTQGIGSDDIQSTSFVLSHSSVNLTLDLIAEQDFAARLTSVGDPDGGRGGSLKLPGTAPPPPPPEECPFEDCFAKPNIVYDDTIDGTPGNDSLIGTFLKEVINGEAGNDFINGKGGNDLLSGGDGNDRIRGEAGHDYMEGGAGKDTIGGHGGNDTIVGGDDDDVAHGGAGNDCLEGGKGHDYLDGEGGKDKICAGSGNDTVFGSYGDDLLHGDGGADVFLFAGPSSTAGQTDIIVDFESGTDKIDVDNPGAAAVATVTGPSSAQGFDLQNDATLADSLITLSNGHKIWVLDTGLAAGDLI